MFNPTVSVLVPFFNRPTETIRAVKSVLAQTYNNYEIILINDGSNVDINEVFSFCANYENIKIINQENQGPASARNHGIKIAQGLYIAFLDSDDEWMNDKLDKQIKYMISNKLSFSHTSYKIINELNNSKKIIESGKINYKFPSIAFHNKIATPTVIFKKSLILNHEITYIGDYRVGEDAILWCHLVKKTILWGMPDILSIVYQSPNSSSLNDKNKRLAFYSINKCLHNNKIIQFIHLNYIYLRILFRTL